MIWFLDERWLSLTNNTVNFSKAFMTFLEDALKLPTADSKIFVDDILHDIFFAQLKHLENSLSSGKYKAEVNLILASKSKSIESIVTYNIFCLNNSQAKFIQKNATFLLHIIIPLAQNRISQVHLQLSPSLLKLKTEYDWLTDQSMTSIVHSPSERPYI